MFGGSAYPHNFNGTETEGGGGGGASLSWQKIGSDGTEIKRFSPTVGYDFSSEIPTSANLFAVSDAGLSYVSESDDQGTLSWRLVLCSCRVDSLPDQGWQSAFVRWNLACYLRRTRNAYWRVVVGRADAAFDQGSCFE